MRILAVDTDEAALKTLVTCLCAIYPDGEIAAFTDPLLAIKEGYSRPVDALFTEIDMKGLGGFDVARLIKTKQESYTPVYFFSATEEHRTDVVRFMADGYLTKPITKEKLIKLLQEEKAV